MLYFVYYIITKIICQFVSPGHYDNIHKKYLFEMMTYDDDSDARCDGALCLMVHIVVLCDVERERVVVV